MERVQIQLANAGNELILREGDAASIYERKAFKYSAYSTDSFIQLIKAKAHKGNAVIAYCDTGIHAIMDDKVFDRDQDRLSYDFKYSQQYSEWESVLGGAAADQRSLIKFLKRREPGEVIDGELLMAALQNFKFVTNITGDFTYDDNNNYTFGMKIGDAEGTVRLPQMIYVSIEVFNESGFFQDVEIELEVVKPKSEQEKLMFTMQCPKLDRYIRAAAEYEINKVKAELDGYLIVTGRI